MIQLSKTKNQLKNKIFFKSSIGNGYLFFIDNIKLIPNNVQLQIKNHEILFESLLGKLSLLYQHQILFFKKKKKLIFIVLVNKNKKSILNLYNKLIQIKIKGVLQGFKLNLILNGIGFKSYVEDNKLILKLGYSHLIIIPIPSNIKVITQSNNLILNSIDFINLSQFVHFIKNFKKPEPYKGKGILLKNETILRKEGKKSKK